MKNFSSLLISLFRLSEVESIIQTQSVTSVPVTLSTECDILILQRSKSLKAPFRKILPNYNLHTYIQLGAQTQKHFKKCSVLALAIFCCTILALSLAVFLVTGGKF